MPEGPDVFQPLWRPGGYNDRGMHYERAISALGVSGDVHDSLVREAVGAFPDECCGVLGGRRGRAERVYSVPNAALSRRTRYEMAPSELWAAQRRVRHDGLEVFGFYHSHPRTSPVPSAYDIEHAYYPDTLYVIVGVEPRPSVKAYRITGGCIEEVAVTIGYSHDD